MKIRFIPKSVSAYWGWVKDTDPMDLQSSKYWVVHTKDPGKRYAHVAEIEPGAYQSTVGGGGPSTHVFGPVFPTPEACAAWLTFVEATQGPVDHKESEDA